MRLESAVDHRRKGRFPVLLSAVLLSLVVDTLGAQTVSVKLSTSAVAIGYGKPLTLTATVSPSAATGEISFFDESSLLGTQTLIDGKATLRLSTLSLGAHRLLASYAGDANYAPVLSTAFRQHVLAATTTAIISSVNPSVYGQTVTLTARISPPGANGHVTFYDSAAILGTRTVSQGEATLTTSSLAAGPHRMSARYTGDFRFAPSVSSSLTHQTGPIASAANGFQPAMSYPGGGITAAVADFNRDGKADLAIANEFGGINVLFGNGDGTFQPPVNYPLPSGASSIAVADFNRDGNPDLVIAGPGGVSVLLSSDAGTFQPAVTYVAAGRYVTIGDFNADGIADLAITGDAGNLSVLLGNNDGTFQPALTYVVAPGQLKLAAVGDFNGDGQADLALSGFNGVNILLGNGDGTFQPAQTYAAGDDPSSVAIADFNGDNQADLVVSSLNGVSIFLGNGDGTFQPAQTYAAPSGLVVPADFNGDAKQDLVVVAYAHTGFNLLLGNGDGTFQPPAAYSLNSPNSITFAAAADFNGDGRPDLALLYDRLDILLGGNATQLKFVLQPVDTVAGTRMSPVSLQSVDAAGSPVSMNVPVTLTSLPAGINTTVMSVNGVAQFNNLVLTAPGSYSLTASAAGLTSGPSNSFSTIAALRTIQRIKESATGGDTSSFLSGVTMTLTGSHNDSAITDALGNYTFNSLSVGDTVTVTPVLLGYTFSPPSQTFTDLTVDLTANFTATATPNVTISGQVTLAGVPLAGVAINVTGSLTVSTTTDLSGTYSITLPGNGSYTVTASLLNFVFGAPAAFPNLLVNQTANFSAVAVLNQTSRALFLDTHGSVQMTTYPSPLLSNAGGNFLSDPSAAEDLAGNVVVTARDTHNSIWANVYNFNTSTWGSWAFGGGVIQGMPSLAVDINSKAWIASRDPSNSYWLVSYTPAAGFAGWTPLYGVFATDPVIASCNDGSLYLVGKDNYNSLWSGHYIPGPAGFQGWQFGGGIVTGKPTVTCGRDNALYIGVEDTFNSNWIARVSGNTWTGWFHGGALTNVPPRVVALGDGTIAVIILDPTNVVWRTTFNEGPGNGWQPWTQVGGVLQDVAPSAANRQLYFVGKAPNGDLWWWQQTGNQWTWIGNNGMAPSALSATPR